MLINIGDTFTIPTVGQEGVYCSFDSIAKSIARCIRVYYGCRNVSPNIGDALATTSVVKIFNFIQLRHANSLLA